MKQRVKSLEGENLPVAHFLLVSNSIMSNLSQPMENEPMVSSLLVLVRVSVPWPLQFVTTSLAELKLKLVISNVVRNGHSRDSGVGAAKACRKVN